MSWLIWNIRGVHRQESIDHLKVLLRQQDISFLAFMEPKASHTEIYRLTFKLGFPYCYHGGESNSHIWIFWQANIQVDPLYVMDQAISIRIMSQGQHSFVASMVYANCLKRVRRNLWDHLYWVGQNTASPWIITEDFNVISNISEKIGG